MEEIVALAWPYAMAVLVVLGAIALIVLIVVLVRVAGTMKSVQNMAAEAEKEVNPALAKVNPMVDKAELMLDTVNLEMLRVDAILEDVEQITDVAGKAATTVDTVTSAPAEAVTSLMDRIRGSLGSKRSNREKKENLVFPVSSSSQSKGDDSSDAAKGEGAHSVESSHSVDEPTIDITPVGKHSSDAALKQEAQRVADVSVDIPFGAAKADADVEEPVVVEEPAEEPTEE